MSRTLEQLKSMIVNGELNPGEQIRQEEMADSLGVSRVPLREAMNVLVDQGLLFHRPHQGYFVIKRLSEEHAQIRRMLQLLESELMSTVVWPDAAMLSTLKQLNADMRIHSANSDVRRMVELNRQFHFHIFSLSPCKLILGEVRRLWSMAEPLMWRKFERESDRSATLEEHDRLVSALADRDRKRCAEEMDKHRYSDDAGPRMALPPSAAAPFPAPRRKKAAVGGPLE